MGVLGRDGLRLSDEEARGIAGLQTGGALTEVEIRRICDSADGWAAGVILLSEIIGGQASFVPCLPAEVPEEVFDYFAAEVFAGLDETRRDFLRRTAFVKDITPHLAERLTGRNDAGSMLARLHAGNYFTQRYQQPDAVYCYHPLFREFLLKKAGETYSLAEIVGLRRKAARFFEDRGNIEEAAGLYIDSGDWRALSSLTEARGREMLAQGRDRSLKEWLSFLPEDIVSTRPWLQFLGGACCMASGYPAASRPFFERAYVLFVQQEDRRGVLLSWTFVVETYLHEMGDTRPLDRWIKVMDDIVSCGSGPLPVEVDDPVVVRMFAALAVRQSWHPHFSQWKEKEIGRASCRERV